MASPAKVYHAVGKRKTSIARVYIQSGEGKISVNDRPIEGYFESYFQNNLKKPLKLLDAVDNFDIRINVFGGGPSAQADACMYGIAKALTLLNPDNRPPLKKAMMLTRDARIVERKKYGHKKARKSFQFSKR